MAEGGLTGEQVSGSTVVAPATGPETMPKPADSQANELAALKAELEGLKAWKQETEGRLASVPDRETIVGEAVDRTIKDPRMKQKTDDLIRYRMELQKQREVEKRTAVLDAAEEQGAEFDPKVRKALDRAIKAQVDKEVEQEYAERPREEAAAPLREPDWNAWGDDALRAAGLTRADIPELQKGSVGFDVLVGKLIPKYATVKKVAEEEEARKAKWMKEYEEAHKPVKEAEQAGAVTTPPAGTAVSVADPVARLQALNALKRRLTADEIAERRQLQDKLESQAK